eukprot:13309-Heterococcus_DN1.PRE.1
MEFFEAAVKPSRKGQVFSTIAPMLKYKSNHSNVPTGHRRGSGGGSSRRGSADSASSDGLALACSTNSVGGATAGAAAIGSGSSS